MTSVKICPLLLLSFSLLSMAKDCEFPVVNVPGIILSSESIQKNNFPDHSSTTVVCAKGHKKESGSDSILCTNGTWSAVELKCKKMDCGLPEASPHMYYSILEGTLFGAVIKPYCERKYDLEGSSHKQCLVNGWNGKSECTLITCDEPESIANGTFSKPREIPEYDDVIEYSCDENYILVGNRSITCVYWAYSSPPPTCKEIKCPVPEIHFGNQTEGNPPYFYKSKATFECWPGYSMKGSATSVCEESGWSALPVCVFITQKAESTTTIRATTTATVTATNHTNGRYGDKHINHPLIHVRGVITTVTEGHISSSFLVILVILGFFAAFLIIFFMYRSSKQRGANNRTAPLL